MVQPAEPGLGEISRAAHAVLPKAMAHRIDGYVEAQLIGGADPRDVAEAVVRAVWADAERHYAHFAKALKAQRAPQDRPSPRAEPPTPSPVAAPAVTRGGEAAEPRRRPGRVAAFFAAARRWAGRSMGRAPDGHAPIGIPAGRIGVVRTFEVTFAERSDDARAGVPHGMSGPGAVPAANPGVHGPGAVPAAGPGQSVVASAAWASVTANPAVPARQSGGRVETRWAAARASTGTDSRKRPAPRR